MALHGRMGTFEASQDSQPRVRFGVRWGEGGGTGLLKWASPPHVDFAFPPASLPRPRTTQPWFFHLLPTKTLSRDSSIHVEGGKGGETNPFDLRWGSGAERESPYHRNKVGFSKSALPLRRKDLPLQVVILRAQECSLSWHYGTLLKPSKSDPGKGGGTTLETFCGNPNTLPGARGLHAARSRAARACLARQP